MLGQSQLDDLSHPDRLQRELALTWARALHSHTCAACGMLRVCTVIACEYRPFDRGYLCCQCKVPESASDEVSGGGDE